MTDAKKNEQTSVEHRRFTKIEGLSDKRRLPRLGKLHLGIRDISPKTKNEYPKATDYFVVEKTPLGAAVESAYGKNPRELTVLLPLDDPEQFFPQEYKSYKSGKGKWCHGNGKRGQRLQDGGGWIDIPCSGMGDEVLGVPPCPEFEAKKCKVMANLMVVLPLVSMYGVFQIDTSSINSIVDINSGIDAIRKAAAESSIPVAHVPATLRIVSRQVSVEGKRKAVHTMILTVASHQEIKRIRGKLEEVRQALGGEATPMLPAPDPEIYPEKDLIERSTWEGAEPEVVIDAEPEPDVPPQADPADAGQGSSPLSAPDPAPPGLRTKAPLDMNQEVANAWTITALLAKDMGVNSDEALLMIAQDVSGREPGCLEDITKEEWRKVWKHLADIKGHGGKIL